MNKNAIIVIAIILVLLGGAAVYMSRNASKKTVTATPTPTPTLTAETFTPANETVENSVITVKNDSKSEKLTFHNSSGYVFKSYKDTDITDRVVVSKNGTDLLQLGVDWLGYSNGNLPLLQVNTVKNQYIGNLYRASGGGIADGGYTLAKNVTTTGKCSGNDDVIAAPCTEKDQIVGKSGVFSYLVFCMDLDQVAECDELMSGLEITK